MQTLQDNKSGIQLVCGRRVTFELDYYRLPGTTEAYEYTDKEGNRRGQFFYYERSPEEIAKCFEEVDRFDDDDRKYRIMASVATYRENQQIVPREDLLGIYTEDYAYVRQHGQRTNKGWHAGNHTVLYLGATEDDCCLFDTMWSDVEEQTIQKIPKKKIGCFFFSYI